jgi:hypothetical protein
MNRLGLRAVRLVTAVVAAGTVLGGAAVGPAVAAPPVTGHVPVRAAAASSVTGSRTALVVTVALNGATNLPTPSTVAANVIDASRPWFEQASHGLFGGYFALKRGPVTVQSAPDLKVCSGTWLENIGDQANAAIIKHEPSLDVNQNGNLEEFGAVVYYFATVPKCLEKSTDPELAPNGAAGWADPPTTSNRVWLNGYSDQREAVHELGHNLGLSHSGSQTCTDPSRHNVQVPLGSSLNCSQDPYGDAFSAMGDHLADGYSPVQLAQLGWNDGHVATVTASGATSHYVLTAPEVSPAGSTEAIRLVDGTTTLWLEYRRPTSQTIHGSTFEQTFTDGLLVRHEQTSPAGQPLEGSPFLLFMNQTEYPTIFDTDFHPNMVVGQTWVDPLGTMQISLDSANPTSATITIRPAAPPPPPTAQVPNILFLTTADAQSRITAARLSPGIASTEQDTVCDDAGKVIRQTPSAGTTLLRGGRVDYVVATPATGSNCTGPPVGERTTLDDHRRQPLQMAVGSPAVSYVNVLTHLIFTGVHRVQSLRAGR